MMRALEMCFVSSLGCRTRSIEDLWGSDAMAGSFYEGARANTEKAQKLG